MKILEWFQFSIGALLILNGLFIFAIELYGVYKLQYVLNRMHAAAMGDTLGILSTFSGLMVISGWNFTSVKLGLVILFFWFASPVSSHLISRLEVTTNEKINEKCEVKQ